MNVDPAQLLEDGFIILPDIIPHDQLSVLRDQCEVMVERRKERWASERGPDDPPGGHWETSAQPRIQFSMLVDEATTDTIGFCLEENTLGVSRQVMRTGEAVVHQMSLMCSPQRDHGPSAWHRDIDPVSLAPMKGLQLDMMANGPAYVQWNIPLYDDNVFWIVPGSHRRPNTVDEHRQLLDDPHVPLPDSMPVELRAGDGIVYSYFLLHWGSNYSTKLRRTIHISFDAFRSENILYGHNFYWEPGFADTLPDKYRTAFERFIELHLERADLIEATFRAILGTDEVAFLTGLAAVHPGEEGRMVCLILLSKLANKVHDIKHGQPIGLDGLTPELHNKFADRFDDAEADLLRERFRLLTELLHEDAKRTIPDMDSRTQRLLFTEMPAEFGLKEFIANWDA